MQGLSGKARLLVAVGLACLAVPASAEDAQITAARFGARQTIQSISLSPDGTKLAMVVPGTGGAEVLTVVDLKGDNKVKPILVSKRDQEKLASCRWATDVSIVCTSLFSVDTQYGRNIYSRLFSLNADGSNVQVITKESNSNSLYDVSYGGGVIDWTAAGKPGSVLVTRQFVPDAQLGSHMGSDKEGIGVEAVDVATLKRSVVEKPSSTAREYIADGHGQVRIMGLDPETQDYSKGIVNYLYRKPGSRNWEKLAQTVSQYQTESGFSPIAVDSDKNIAYGFDDAGGYQALYAVSLDGTGAKKMVLSRKDTDIDGLIRIGRSRRVVGASYATEKRSEEFFDPELKALRESLGRAIPQHPIISFVDSSADENKLLIYAGSDTDPGVFYLFDKTTKELNELLPIRPPLKGVAMGQMKPITFPAADGTMIPGYLTLPPGSDGKNLPAIVLPHGGPSSRTEWGFDWLSEFFAARGYAVLQPNFRGSSGMGSAWFQKNGFQSWRTAIGDVNDAGRWLEKQGIAAPGKLAIFGWSYGGYAALQVSALDPNLFKAIVAVAPVTDLPMLLSESQNRSTYRLAQKFIGTGPHVKEGSPSQNVAAIKAPVLLFHGDRDDNVGVGESRLMASKLKAAGKSVEYVEFPGLDHQLDDPDARTKLLSMSDAFLRRNLGIAP